LRGATRRPGESMEHSLIWSIARRSKKSRKTSWKFIAAKLSRKGIKRFYPGINI
jgi:hypothetical protein